MASALPLCAVKIKCAYHTNGVLYGTVGVLITLMKVWLALTAVSNITLHFCSINISHPGTHSV